MLQTNLNQANQLNLFLASVEQRAWRIAAVAVNNPDDALDITQESMLVLVEKYGDKPSGEWPPLFWRIHQNKIRDHQRRHGLLKKWFSLSSKNHDDDNSPSLEELYQDPTQPIDLLGAQVAADEAHRAIQALPARQREAFCLRVWEGLDVKQTALAMGCSAGSVKTHLHRALESLRQSLGQHLDTLPEGDPA